MSSMFNSIRWIWTSQSPHASNLVYTETRGVSREIDAQYVALCLRASFVGILGSIAAGGDPVDLADSGKLWVFIVALVVVVGAYLACIIFNRFVISKGTGYALIATYVSFLVFVILYELFISETDTSGGCGA